MFTIKFYSEDGFRQRILEAESFTVLRGGNDGEAEITLHQKNAAEDYRIDIRRDEGKPREPFWPPIYQKAIIENSAGKTTEIITLGPKSGPQTQGIQSATTSWLPSNAVAA